uniref:Uncharacterized protein n=1 Tax=Romanomermis culicivorax TaxID=13658 RepID=A0A915HI61_ROMCU
MRSRERKGTDSRTRERPSQSTARKESDDYNSRKYHHGEYASNEHPRKYHHNRNYRREHSSDSKDCQTKVEWVSALKQDQLRKKELEGQQPPTADSEEMIDEPTTSQQAEEATDQQKPQRIMREYKILYR